MTKTFNCTKCSAWFKRKAKLDFHMKDKHGASDDLKEWVKTLVKKGLVKA